MMSWMTGLRKLHRSNRRLGEWQDRGPSHLPGLDDAVGGSALAHPASLAAWLSHGYPSSCWSRISPSAVWSRCSPMACCSFTGNPGDVPDTDFRVAAACILSRLDRPQNQGRNQAGATRQMKVVCEKETCRRLKSSESRGLGLPDVLRKTLYYQLLAIQAAEGHFALG